MDVSIYNSNLDRIGMVKIRGKLMETKCITIDADPEFIEILNLLEEKVKKATWDGVDKLSKRTLTKILARKIKDSKLI